MRDFTDYDGQVTAPDADYLSGNLKNNSGANDGTRMNVKMFSDLWQAMFYFVRQSGITPNGLPDNETNGYELVNAFITALHDPGTILREDRSSSIGPLLCANNPLLELYDIGTGDVGLEDSTQDSELHRQSITIVNNSSSSVDIFPGGSDTIAGLSSLAIPNGSKARLVLDKINANWIITYLV